MAGVTLSGVSKRFGSVTAIDRLDLEIRDHEFISFLGPSGCGKTTTLNMIAGLEVPSAGAIRIGERDVTSMPAMRRDIAMVFQSYALYPHMTVARNLGFALKVRGLPAAEIESRVRETASMLSLDELLDRYPRQLSGGQRQRVALGRAIVRAPQVFLLDEPLSNLDAVLRVQTRAELRRLFQRLRTTTIYVTHDQSEAMTMSDRIAVFRGGRLQQVGTPLEIYRAPANRFVAGFVGSPPMNVLPAAVASDGRIAALGSSWPAPPGFHAEPGRKLLLGLRPEDIRLGGGLTAGLEIVEHLGSAVILHLAVGGATLVAQSVEAGRLAAGDRVPIDLDSALFYLFDPESEATLAAPGRSRGVAP
jgi:ABC-type sugar transport system ATPase subunit